MSVPKFFLCSSLSSPSDNIMLESDANMKAAIVSDSLRWFSSRHSLRGTRRYKTKSVVQSMVIKRAECCCYHAR